MIRYVVSGLVLALGVWLAIFLLSDARVTNDERTTGTRVSEHDRGNRSSNLVEPSPFPSPTRENVHLSIARLDETWTILNDINSEERHRLSFAEIVPVLGSSSRDTSDAGKDEQSGRATSSLGLGRIKPRSL